MSVKNFDNEDTENKTLLNGEEIKKINESFDFLKNIYKDEKFEIYKKIIDLQNEILNFERNRGNIKGIKLYLMRRNK